MFSIYIQPFNVFVIIINKCVFFLQEIYSWDSGNQLTYPIKYIDIGYNTPYEDKTEEKPKKTIDYDQDFEISDNNGKS